MKLINRSLLGCLFAGLLAGCASTNNSYSPNTKRSIDEYYHDAQQYIRVGDLDEAADLIRSMEIRYPFHAVTHKLQLELAYAYSHQQHSSQAISIANRFISQYPYHEKVDYAYYIKALTNFNQGTLALNTSRHPDPKDADPRIAREAFKNFADLIRRFPNSQYLSDSKKRMAHLRTLLARHEVAMAEQALDNNDLVMATKRAQYVLDNYPNTPAINAALNIVARASESNNESDVAITETIEEKPEALVTPSTVSSVVDDSPLISPKIVATQGMAKAPQPTLSDKATFRSNGSATKPNIHGEDWLLAQNPAHYTIQLVGTSKENSLTEFFNEKNFAFCCYFYFFGELRTRSKYRIYRYSKESEYCSFWRRRKCKTSSIKV